MATDIIARALAANGGGGGEPVDAYTKAETNDLLANKADKNTSYTKTEVNNLLAEKEDNILSFDTWAEYNAVKDSIPADTYFVVKEDEQENPIPSHNSLMNRDANECHPINAITGLQAELDKKTDATDTDVLKARMDQLVGTVPPGSADEIADARVMVDGKTSQNLGDAIRTQVTSLKETIDTLISAVTTSVEGYAVQGGISSTGEATTSTNALHFAENIGGYDEDTYVTIEPDGLMYAWYLYDSTEIQNSYSRCGQWIAETRSVLIPKGKYINMGIRNAAYTNITPDQNTVKIYAPAAKIAEKHISEVDSTVSALENIVYNGVEQFKFESSNFHNGLIKSTTGEITYGNAASIFSDIFTLPYDVTLSNTTGYNYNIHKYKDNIWESAESAWIDGARTVKAGTQFRVAIKKSNSGNVALTDCININTDILYVLLGNDYVSISDNVLVMQGGITATGEPNNYDNAVHFAENIGGFDKDTYVVVDPNGLWFSWFIYDDQKIKKYFDRGGQWIKEARSILIPKGKYINIGIRNAAYTSITPMENTVKIYASANAKTKSEVNYSIGSDFVKRNINIKRISTQLKYYQSFLKYDGHYYSTNGNSICKQTEDFTEVSDVPLNLGHGNAFHRGDGNKAYVSGWDDNKVYVVNLDTIEITDTIDLPTTGYTTCAVDDVNKIVYIFQRNTFPDTLDYYNLITYDYEHDNVLYTKKSAIKFDMMQACDFYRGKIIALNGGIGDDHPRGYRIYNTNFDILSEFVLNLNEEPEGVYLDRETHELLINTHHRDLYNNHQCDLYRIF